MSDNARFELHILQGTWSSMQLGYDLEPAWAALRDGYASASAFSLTENDVEAYDWQRQIFTLSSAASQALVDQFAETDEQREHPDAALDQRAFVVTVDGDPIYGGIFLHPMSSMGIYFPVIYVTAHEGVLAFTLRPIQSVLGDYAEYEPEWHGIKDPRVREVFEAAGVLIP